MNHHDESLVIMSLQQLGTPCEAVIQRRRFEESSGGVDGFERKAEVLDVISGI